MEWWWPSHGVMVLCPSTQHGQLLTQLCWLHDVAEVEVALEEHEDEENKETESMGTERLNLPSFLSAECCQLLRWHRL